MGDLFKTFLTLVSGGAGGAIITFLLRRRSERLQTIPLVERVNRVIDPNVKGYVLARAKGKGAARELEEIRRVREYQFTLRNTSTVHLHDAEIQFEFAAEDVEAWAERPILSKTAPTSVEAQATEPWKRAFRWRIPEFPSSDSIEFTFRAVDPPFSKNEYEAALYNSPQVVIRKTNRELPEGSSLRKFSFPNNAIFPITMVMMLGLLLAEIVTILTLPTGNRTMSVYAGGCSLSVKTSSTQVDSGPSSMLMQSGPFDVETYVRNIGSQKCSVQLEGQTGEPDTIGPGRSSTLTSFYTNDRPKRVPRTILYGPSAPTNRVLLNLYWGHPL